MPEYKLTYFNARGRAEFIRLIFHASGTKFVDHRIEGKDWPTIKPTIPLGTLPACEIDGETISQSLAIGRYIARQTGLAGKNAKEELKADELVDLAVDLMTALFKVRFEKDETKKEELGKALRETTMPNFLQIVTKQLIKNGGNFLVGKSLTWADLVVFDILDVILGKKPALLDQAPELKAHRKRIEELPRLSSYLKSRPPSDN